MGKAILSIVGLLLACCVFGIFAPRSAPQAAASQTLGTAATDVPTIIDFPTRLLGSPRLFNVTSALLRYHLSHGMPIARHGGA